MQTIVDDDGIMHEVYTKKEVIEELEKMLAYTDEMAEKIINQGVNPVFDFFNNKDEALALYGYADIKGRLRERITEIKENK